MFSLPRGEGGETGAFVFHPGLKEAVDEREREREREREKENNRVTG